MENLKSLLDQRFFLLTRQGMKSLDFSRVILEDLGSCSDVLTNIADNIVRKEERLFKARVMLLMFLFSTTTVSMPPFS